MKRLSFGLVLLAACGEVTTSGNDNPPPTVESVSPGRGGVLGRTVVTVTGTGFADNGADDVYVVANGLVSTEVEVADDSTLTFTLPPGDPGQIADVVVFNGNGFGVLSDAITYNPLPTVQSVSPRLIPSGGGTISVFGSGFEQFAPGTNNVTAGEVDAESVTVVDDNEIEVTFAARPEDVAAFDPLDLSLVNDNGVATNPDPIYYTGQGFLAFGRNPTFESAGGFPITFVDTASTPARTVVIGSTVHRITGAVVKDDSSYTVMAGRCRRGPFQYLADLDPRTGILSNQVLLAEDGNDGGNGTRGLVVVGEDLVSRSAVVDRLIRIDRDTGEFAPVGVAADGLPNNYRGLALDDANSVYLLFNTAGPLYTVSSVDSTVEVNQPLNNGTFDNEQVGDIALDGDSLLVITKNSAINVLDASVMRIDLGTFEVSHVAELRGGGSAIVETPASW